MNLYALISLACFVVLVVVGCHTYIGNPRSDAGRAFLLFASFCAYWALVEFGYRISVTREQALFWTRAGALRPLAVALIARFVFVYTGRNERRGRALLYGGFYLPALSFVVLDLWFMAISGMPREYRWGWGNGPSPLPLVYDVYLVWTVTSALCVAWFVVRYYRTSRDGAGGTPKEVRLFFVSMMVLTVLGLTSFLVDNLTSLMPEMTVLTGAAIVAVFAYLVNRLGLFTVTPQTAAEDIVAVIPDCLLLVGSDGKILRVNDATVELGGYEEGELRGRGVDEVVGAALGTARGDVAEAETTFRKADGQTLPFLCRGAAIRGRDGTVLGTVLIGQDLTRRKRTEAELARARRLRSLEVVAGGIAHDFNNLLTSISANLSLARTARRGPAKNDKIETAEKACYAAAELTRQLMNFSTERPLVKKPCRVRELVDEAVALSLCGTNVTARTAVAEHIRPLDADRHQLLQVLMNLLINARQAMPDGGVVRIEADNHPPPPRSTDPFIEIRIEDRGPGIPPSVIEHIFEPFYTTKDTGCGLGLVIAESIVKRHGGSITAATAPGGGALVTLKLPAATTHVPPAAVSGDTPVPKRSGRILIMDDDEMVRRVLGESLQRMGFEVVQASEGAEALELYLRARSDGHPFHSLILDLSVSQGFGGKEIIDQLRKIDPDVKAIIASGYSHDEVVLKHRDFGFSGALTKPFTVDELRKAIDELCAVS
jgi:PAS domain S-box-containing protein